MEVDCDSEAKILHPSSFLDSSEDVKPRVEVGSFIVIKHEPSSICPENSCSSGKSPDFKQSLVKKEISIEPLFQHKEKDEKPILESEVIVIEDEPVSLFEDDSVLEQESSESNNMVKTEPQCEYFYVKPEVEDVVKEEASDGADLKEMGETEGQVGEGKEICAELVLGEGHVSQSGEMQLQISNVRSLRKEIISLMSEDEDSDESGFNLKDKTESYSSASSSKGAPLSRHPCPLVIRQPSRRGNRKLGKHGYLSNKGKGPVIAYECELCGDEFANKGKLNVHVRKHEIEKPYKCEVCGICFASRDNLKSHKKTHAVEKPYKCELCGIKIKYKASLDFHRRNHTTEKFYNCEVCGAGFTDSRSYWVHIRIHAKKHTKEKSYKCEVCGAGFDKIGKLKLHKKIHKVEKLYKCEDCGVGFARRGSLCAHNKNVHKGEKPFKCEVCGSGFKTGGRLRCHKKIHTGERPFKCDICGQCFLWKKALQIHLKTHTGEKPYRCKSCGDLFPTTSQLRIHEMTHTGERPHKCEICGAEFVQSNQLKIHKETCTRSLLKKAIKDIAGKITSNKLSYYEDDHNFFADYIYEPAN